MVYETSDYVYENHFNMQIFFKNELVLPEKTESFYAMILFNGCNLCVTENTSSKIFYDCGLLILSPDHKISSIKVLGDNKNKTVQTLIFSPFGINTNFTSFPDSFEYKVLTDLKSGYASFNLDARVLEIFLNNFENVDLFLNRAQEIHWPCIVRSYILELIILLSRNSYIKKADNPAQNIMNNILEYFQYSYGEKITLDSISKMFATNRTTLNAMFNDTFGISAIACLNKIRIQNASLLLTNTSIPLCDIAERTGFSDESYFSKAFKKSTGKTPKEFRLSLPHPHSEEWQEYSLSDSPDVSWKTS